VLCVDNEPAVLAGMEALLTGWGCRVRTAPSAAKAVELVTRGPVVPDAILADYHLDSGTGLMAVQAVREALGVEIPAVIITADHTAEVMREVKGMGLALLRKPLKAAALRALLTQYLQRRAAAAE
jgi:CheY-like chemotaxis protein